jgi:glutathione S-transferase
MSSATPTRSQPMLIGQYDSPFVRRVAIALVHYGIAYEHAPWSVWADADAIAHYNPLRRVPTLVLEDETVLIESYAILDELDQRAGARRLIAASGPARREALHVIALATGLADKAVSLLYEFVLRQGPMRSRVWADRCTSQIGETLRVLEALRTRCATPWWFGAELNHADIAVACALGFAREAHPELVEPALGPSLRDQLERCESRPEFQQVRQPLLVLI